MGTSHSSLTDFVNAHVFLMLESDTLGTGSRRGLTALHLPQTAGCALARTAWLAIRHPQLKDMLLSAIQPAVQAFSDAGNNMAIRPLDSTVSNETGKYIIFMGE